jgi:hypothetical protein
MTQVTTNIAMFFLHAKVITEGFVSSTSTRNSMIMSMREISSA